MPLEMLGKYERLDVLGHGASGIVYLAKDTLLGKQVALKEITAQGEEKQRFLEEARVLDRLRHPNIVRVNSVDEIGGRIVIDMEYVRGRTLQDILRDTPQLPIPQAVDIAAQVCDGLAYAHSQRTVHRDIKPANILLSRDGVVKLVDFGLAEVLGTHSFAGGAGTYAYMAPEDFHPAEQSDRQSDIWAVGVVLYEMLAGRRPFQVAKAKDPFAWKQAIENDPLPPLREFRPDVPPGLEAVAVRALTRDKAGRYRDAAAMADDLRGEIPSRLAGSPPSPVREGPQREQDKDVAATPSPNAWSEGPSLTGEGGEERDGRGSYTGRGPGLTGFPSDLADIDAFLALAPDHWEAARDALEGGALSYWLRGLGEEPLALVADEAGAEPDRDEDDRLRDFLYRAGLETAEEARRAHHDAQRLTKAGRFAEAVPWLRRSVRLDPNRLEYAQDLAAALRATGDGAGAALVLEQALVHHPAQRKLVREHAALAGTQAVLSETRVDFGVLRLGQTRARKVTLRNTGVGVLEGRVSAAPGWVRVDPPAFSTRKRQTLTLTAQTEGVPSAPASYEETVTLETSGGRQEMVVAVSVLPARLSWGRVFPWYLPLLISAILPGVAGLLASSHLAGGGRQPGFIASGLLSLAVFVLSLAADLTWAGRLLPLGLAALNAWLAAQVAARPSATDTPQAHLALVQTVTPVLVLLILQACAFSLDAPGWGRWQIWRWIIGATGLLVAYSLLHLG